MGTERGKYSCKIGNTRVVIQGAKYFYGDSNVQAATGWKTLNDGDTDDNVLEIDGARAKQFLVRLVAKLSGQFAGGVGTNQSQDDSQRLFAFYCDPSKVEDAILKLKGNNVDPGLGLGSMKITKVYRPRKVSYQ